MKRRSDGLRGALLALPLASLMAAAAPAQGVTTPGEHLGRPLGVDFELADWEEVSSYHRLLAAESPRVQVERVGSTTEGRDFLRSVISSEANLANLEGIRRRAAILADPRGHDAETLAAAVEDGRLIVFVSCAMHATETAAPQMGMQLAWLLATSEDEPWKSVRDELVIVLFPSLNPDGLDHVVSWYRETVGTPYEASGLLKLYQYYAGHDNNRDWFMLTQAETRIVTQELYSVWHPQVYWDVHQQGSTRERLFVPPFRDPLNPNLDPGVIAAIDALGSRALLDLTRAGLSGVSTGVSYDMWWNGGNRNVPVRHNIVGLLTEAASVDIASPVFLSRGDLSAPRGLGGYAPSNRFPDPWPGGWWRLRDIIDYELAFGESLFGSLARERRLWMQNALDAAQRAIEAGREDAPRAWIVPADNRDPAAVRRLAAVLLASGVELYVAEGEVEADGRRWPAGSLVVRSDQPYGAHVKDLFEVQRYPAGDPPYDVAGWTLPLLLGVHRLEAIEEPLGELVRARTAADAIAGFSGDPRMPYEFGEWLSTWDSDAWTRLVRWLQEEKRVTFVGAGRRAGVLVPGEQVANEDEQPLLLEGLPRIGLYSPWSGSMDEGWMRWVLDTWDVPYVTVRNEHLRAGALDDMLDVLILPSVSSRQLDAGRSEGSVPSDFTRGLAPEGAVAVEEFVRTGGRLITLGSSSAWAIDLLRLPLVDVTRGEEGEGFSCPGSVLRAIPEEHPLCGGLAPSLALFFSRSAAWRGMTDDERKEAGREDTEVTTLLRYAPTRLLLSGWVESPQVVAGKSAWVSAAHGEGRVHLFGFRPQYRGWSQATFSLLFRAALLPWPAEEEGE